MPIDKTYDPAATEAKLYASWEKSGAFACDVASKAQPYCIMMPPPNVTGSLHMGHALNHTLQDILIRYQRMKGRDALWQPGTDHAGIATQMVVERELASKGANMGRREMGREAFLKKVWEWKEESGGTITRQLRRLGASCDWSRERFTMDEGLSRAVVRAFVTLHREGLIYKDKRLVNWDPKMLTAVSDLEVEQREIRGNLWHFKYPIEGSDEFIVIATTRPETMLGDTAVAVHPENERLKHLIGKFVRLPLSLDSVTKKERLIPIISDEYADPEKGSGAVKITPAHDFNDFEVWQRHKEKSYFKDQHHDGLINIFDKHAKIISSEFDDFRWGHKAPDDAGLTFADDDGVVGLPTVRFIQEKYRGLDRFEARKRIVAEMEELGLLDKVEPHTHAVPHGDRSGVVIEPWLSEQWYCDAKALAQPAIKAVEEGRTKFVPEQWVNTYNAWMKDIEPWCISRQLWWGHQIPAWYGPDGKFFVAEDETGAKAEAQKHYGKPVELKRDEDVLDTWFSSGLWPFSTLGWPDETPHLKRYYPTDVLVTGFDIIFFWIARMMMMGLHFMKDVPFRTVYIHALVRDEKGQKMSKTKGNVLDPLDVIEKYGCDALRFTLAHMSTPGRDIRLATSRIEGNRNFATKIWNAARYCEMNECAWQAGFDPAGVKQTVNQWIIGETKLAADKIAAHMDEYRFDLASSAAYDFIWNNFCDWYLEFTKPIIAGTDEAAKAETRAATAWVLGQLLHFLHPFTPYITEELWNQFVGGKMLMTDAWPVLPAALVKKDAEAEIGWLITIISTIRTIRAELNVPAGAKVQLQLKDASVETKARLERHESVITRMARLASVEHVAAVSKGAAQAIVGETTLIMPLADVIDLAQERARLQKESEKWSTELKKLDSKLANRDFVDRASPEIVEEHRERKVKAEEMLAKLEAAQKSLSA
ncbi:MAG: valine--tRNA ligase [Alphaproteobacteria bacterium]|nr:valine--tRNA ligase [Alphaproteobacteria bacterium]